MTPTPTPGLANASADVVNGFGSMQGLAGPLFLVLWALIIIGLLSAVRDSRYVEYVVDALGIVAVSVYYVVHGVAAVTGLTVLLAPGYLLATADPSTQQTVGKYAAGAVVAYAALASIGYVAKHKFTDPARENLSDALPEAEPEAGGGDD